jgi:general L-amino acid transport system permease protein
MLQLPLRSRQQWASIALQAALVVVIGGLAYGAFINAADNLAKAHIASGFRFWDNTAGFDISQTLIGYSPSTSTFGRAFWVGLLNTLLVASLGIVLATALGFTIGIARLSRNWLVARLAGGYVELVRNVPLLLQILFWYNAVLKSLPDLHSSISISGSAFLNNRGLFLPRPEFADNFDHVAAALVFGIIATLAVRIWARRRQERTGQPPRTLSYAFGLIVVLPLLVFVAAGAPLSFSFPDVGRFNIRGGTEILPEFAALLVALTIYTAAFIAEVVRAGILVVPQAMRVIVPPLTSQYLNLIKNSSLAVAIGYPDLVQVFAGSVLNITGQAVEVIAITMAVYLFLSLVTSLLMNLYGRTVGIVER